MSGQAKPFKQAEPSMITQVLDELARQNPHWFTNSVNQPTHHRPPSDLPAAYNEAHALTQQLHRMAFADGLPTADSQGLERLLFRLVRVNEELVAMLAEVIAGRGVGCAPARLPQVAELDDVYQPSYCDVCGEELTPGGDCMTPVCSEYGE